MLPPLSVPKISDLEFWSFTFFQAQHKCPFDYVNANNPKDDYVLPYGLDKL